MRATKADAPALGGSRGGSLESLGRSSSCDSTPSSETKLVQCAPSKYRAWCRPDGSASQSAFATAVSSFPTHLATDHVCNTRSFVCKSALQVRSCSGMAEGEPAQVKQPVVVERAVPRRTSHPRCPRAGHRPVRTPGTPSGPRSGNRRPRRAWRSPRGSGSTRTCPAGDRRRVSSIVGGAPRAGPRGSEDHDGRPSRSSSRRSRRRSSRRNSHTARDDDRGSVVRREMPRRGTRPSTAAVGAPPPAGKVGHQRGVFAVGAISRHRLVSRRGVTGLAGDLGRRKHNGSGRHAGVGNLYAEVASLSEVGDLPLDFAPGATRDRDLD
jgi:hypothetical protein